MTVPNKSDKEEWQEVIDAFNTMQFSQEQQNDIFKIVASVLHLGNVAVIPKGVCLLIFTFKKKQNMLFWF